MTSIRIESSSPGEPTGGLVGAFTGGRERGGEQRIEVDDINSGSLLDLLDGSARAFVTAFVAPIGGSETMNISVNIEPPAEPVDFDNMTIGIDPEATPADEPQAIRIRIDDATELSKYGVGSVLVDCVGDVWQRRSDWVWTRPEGSHTDTRGRGILRYTDAGLGVDFFPAIIVYIHEAN